MRELVEQTIIARYKNGLDEVSAHGIGIKSAWKNPDGTPGAGRYAYMLDVAQYTALQEGRITIEEYVSRLSDEELLEALDSQACLRYR